MTSLDLANLTQVTDGWMSGNETRILGLNPISSSGLSARVSNFSLLRKKIHKTFPEKRNSYLNLMEM